MTSRSPRKPRIIGSRMRTPPSSGRAGPSRYAMPALLLCLGIASGGCGDSLPSQVAPADEAVLTLIPSNTQLVIDGMLEEHKVKLGLDGGSVQWLDNYVNQQRDLVTREMADQMTRGFGCFLGSAIIAKHGGSWVHHEQYGLSVALESGAIVLPFHTLARQFRPENKASIYVVFLTAPKLKK